MSRTKPIDVDRVLSTLKDFQRTSVDYVFDRFYGENPTRHFLLADEVGLGKTLVARGLIARSIEHLRRIGTDRIDIVYICSNADIARQNINRLNVTGQSDFQLASRITLLPTQIHELEANELNFVSFTPGTSFNLRSSTGTGWERWVLYWLLRWTWPKLTEGAGAKNVLQANMSKERFRDWIDRYDPKKSIDDSLAKQFKNTVKAHDHQAREVGKQTYYSRFKDLCARFGYSRKDVPYTDRVDRNALIGELRELLAATCIKALEPDLIILDEFQRFKHLLRDDDASGQLARHLFNWGDARVLLLSATPYKMYTLSHESGEDDHYVDFLDTLKFLLNDQACTEQVTSLLSDYRRATYRLSQDGIKPLIQVGSQLQSTLRRVMARTERLAVTHDRSGMLREIHSTPASLEQSDVMAFVATQRIARMLNQNDVTEYWKSSPYLLNFMEDYQLKRRLHERIDHESDNELVETVRQGAEAMLPWKKWRAYEQVDPANVRLRGLMNQTIGQNLWQLLWIPPSLPYYQPAGVYDRLDAPSVTKKLVFSSWHVVPRAISALLSYEADRQMMCTFEDAPQNTPDAREKYRPLLMFTRSKGRLTGLPVLAMLYPSTALACLGDPLEIASQLQGEGLPPLNEVLDVAEQRITDQLHPLLTGTPADGPEDESWYWAAPILLDRQQRMRLTSIWFEDVDALAEAWGQLDDDRGDKGWRAHLSEAQRVASGEWRPEGRPPRDLAEVLALMAVAGPGICAMRALARVCGNTDLQNRAKIRHAAGRIAWGFRSLFNLPEVMALIRGMNRAEPYWRRVLEYCASGCLQSVLDEYIHMLRESMGLIDISPDKLSHELAEVASAAVGMRVATPGVDEVRISADEASVEVENNRTRARFAMRFGQEKTEEGGNIFRADQVRQAFNSPFWPFVLVTTSIGQEGLDFHPYCHAVVHWNLPSNPVDLEQREGRVHRYKGHAVRKNVARRYAGALHHHNGVPDPWQRLFQLACNEPDRESDLTPFWVYPVDQGAVIERHVPALPMSRETSLLPALRRSLAVYRMVFGQPRQDDLVDYLIQHVPEDQLGTITNQIRIDLTPHGDGQ